MVVSQQSMGLAQAIENLLGSGGVGGRKDVPSGTPSTPFYSGPNGLWSTPGVERDVISTVIMPRGIAGEIPARPTNIMYPLYPFLTGFGEPSGSVPNGVCDDPQEGGAQYNCMTTSVFGRYSYQTRVLDITRAGQRVNNAEPMDLRLVNGGMFAPGTNNNGIVSPSSAQGEWNPRNERLMRMVEVGQSFQNKLMHQVWDGNPVNNSAGGGYKEFPGLNKLITTGHVDAITGTACASVDSDVKNFNYKIVTDSSTISADIVYTLSTMLRYVNSIAERTQLDPVEWAFVMREDLFFALSAIWPCMYMTSGCAFSTSDGTKVLQISADEQIRFRDDMRNQRYLLLDGKRVRVIFDDAINEEVSGDTNRITRGNFASNIYLLPLSIRGGQMTPIYWEYFNWSGPFAAESIAREGNLANYFWTDGGKYLWHAKPPNNWCVQWLALIEPRLVVRTPQLCARLNNVQYASWQHPRDPFSDDPYYVNGGVSSRTTTPSFYREWA